MEFLLELVIELLFEGTIEISSNKKVSKWIRYPLLVILILFFAVVIFGIIIVGLYTLKENTLGGILILATGLFMLGMSIYKFRKRYLEIGNKK